MDMLTTQMSQNPFETPTSVPVTAKRNGSFVCIGMFWLSCVLCIAMLGIAANGSYQYWLYTSRGQTLPIRILAENVCVAGSGIGMLFAAIKWRYQSTRAGAVSFAAALLIFLLGPSLLSFLV